MDRRYFEICLFTQVVNELKSGDLCIPGSEEYGDYRDQLVSWEEYGRDVAGYAEQAGVPADATAFVAGLKARLAATASAADRAFPDNEHVEIVGGEPVVKRLRAREAADGAARPGAAAQGAHASRSASWRRWPTPSTGSAGPGTSARSRASRPSSTARASAISPPPSATAAASGRARPRAR